MPDEALPPGMGALPHPGGVAFRVWAPHAEAVHVTGSFNDWSEDACPLALEGNGVWAGNAPEARPGDEYRFLVHARIAGHGPTLYQSGLPRTRRLELISATPLRCGAVAMHYRRARD